jgi:putative FmdB family regulatory protein
MPIYEYKCDKGHVFEVIQRMTDEPVTECEECGAPVVRVLHSPAVHFKGSGFYNTDYGKKKKGAAATAAAEGGNGASPSESTGDSKPSESSESKPSSDSKAKAAD